MDFMKIGNNFSRAVLIALAVPVLAVSCSQEDHKTGIVAHRGWWDCEEAGYSRNSVASLKAAQDAGFWGSEFDVNMTADKVLLVYHDSNIGEKVIDRTPYSEFKDIRLPNGEPIPTLDDYLEQAEKAPETVLVCELKKHSTPEIEDTLVDLTVSKIREHGLDSPDRVIFISFSINICKRLAGMMPGFTVQYLDDDYSPDDLVKAGINGVDYHYDVFFEGHPDWYQSARDNSMSVNVWTVNDSEDMERLFSLGVDMLTTDKPETARELLGDKERKS